MNAVLATRPTPDPLVPPVFTLAEYASIVTQSIESMLAVGAITLREVVSGPGLLGMHDVGAFQYWFHLMTFGADLPSPLPKTFSVGSEGQRIQFKYL